ncbi:hypothetical protein R1sor_008418 [Riccia sorocarpa]|uniref:YDG domain-containing protein n=1 Tax=Riccia sorocarpa TaxID=122646 RepID=A0ABD3HWU8_9MARC
MSRTFPDLYRRQETNHPEGSRWPPPGSSGEIFVGQGEDNRLIFKSETCNGPTIFNEEDSTGYLPTKDPDRASYLQLRWQFHKSSLQTEESKDLLTALDQIVRILIKLGSSHSRQKQPQGDRPNVNGSEQDLGIAPECDRKVESVFRGWDSGTQNDYELDSPKEISQRNHGHFGNGFVGAGKRSDRKVESARGKDSGTKKNDYELDSPEEIDQRNHGHLGNGFVGGGRRSDRNPERSDSKVESARGKDSGTKSDYELDSPEEIGQRNHGHSGNGFVGGRPRSERNPERSDRKVESARGKDSGTKNDYEEIGQRNHGHLGNGFAGGGKRKFLSENKDHRGPGSSVDYEREEFDNHVKRMKQGRVEPDSRYTHEPSLVYGEEEDYEQQRDKVRRRKLAVDVKNVETSYDRERRGKARYDSGRLSVRNGKQDSDAGWEEEEKKEKKRKAFFDTGRKRSRNETGQERHRASKSASGAGQSEKYGTTTKSVSVIDSESEATNRQNRSSGRLPKRKGTKLCEYPDSSDASDNDTEPLAENGFVYVSDSEAEIVGSNSPPSNSKKLKPAAFQARRDSNPKSRTGDDRKFKKTSRKGKGKMEPLAKCKTSRLEEAASVVVPEVDEAFKNSDWESMDARAKVATILNQFFYLEQHFRAKNEQGQGGASEKGGRWKKRPDLQAGYYLKVRGCCLHQAASIPGGIDGVGIGQVFRYREELRLLGIHRAQQAGIDYISASQSEFRDSEGNPLSVAVSIVSAGGYKDNRDDGKRTLIYTGQGGGYSNKTGGIKKGSNGDQELVRGNLALVNSCLLRVPVRVTRGMVGKENAKKFYVYDGLYDVMEYFEETGASGYKVWKFKLIKQAAQPDIPNNIRKLKMNFEEWTEGIHLEGVVTVNYTVV